MTRQERAGLTKLLVGIDYGTTFSGISYARSDQQGVENVKVVTAWPEGGAGGTGGSNEHLVKVPSRIAYQAENQGKRNFPEGRDAWGYEVEPGYKSYSWTKLLLDKHALPTAFDDPYLQVGTDGDDDSIMTLPAGKTATEVTTDYLTYLYNHCIAEIRKPIKGTIFDITPIEFWFTHPATWSDNAKDATKQAAIAAGFASRPGDSISLIPEPEAAAIAALRSSQGSLYGLAVNTGVLVCDCGGGTVDLTTYTVKALNPQIALDESFAGISGKCGATAIDRSLHALLGRRFRRHFLDLPIEKRGSGSRMMQDFESAKRNFDGGQNRVSTLSLPMPTLLTADDVNEDEYVFEDKLVLLSGHDLLSLYDPVVDQVIELVSQQVQEGLKRSAPAIKTMVLVGGFGSSLYLWKRLETWCQSNGDIDLVSTETSPWSAIVRGAALRGLDGALVHKKICRRHYGTTYDKEFRPGIDHSLLDETYEHDFTGQKMVRGYMDWHFNKNCEIDKDTRKEISFNHFHKSGKKRRPAQLKIYSCVLDTPPKKRSRNVQLVGSVSLNFSKVRLEECRWTVKKNDPQKKVYQINLTCVIKPGNEDGTLHFTVEWEGKPCGDAVMQFEGD